jgi:MFS family permease
MDTSAGSGQGVIQRGTRRERVSAFLGLERNIVAVSGAMFLVGLGEELWKRFIPKYLEALGAPVAAIGLYGTTRDFLDGVYQYPGGWVADRYGRRRALTLFISLAAVGYAIYWLAPSWPFVFAGLVFVMAWTSMASPTLFAVVGDALPKGKRAMGFTVQSILRRIPIIIAPTLGGLAIAANGIRGGIRVGLLVTIALAVGTVILVSRVNIPIAIQHGPTSIVGVWRALPTTFRKLLTSDVFIRTSEGLVDVFLVLYATNVVGISAPQFGALIAVQMVTSILVYLPAARLADRIGRKPFVVATFVAFSLFPIAVVAAQSFEMLILAFVIGGLREIGEPARKALIVDLAEPHLRARSVGLYYLLRSLAITPAAFIGSLLWQVRPSLPFIVAGAIGLVGTMLFVVTVDEEHAG